jgi:hypothetical protein
MPLSPKVEVKAGGIHGSCWFAKEDIKAGEMIWKIREPGAPSCDLILTFDQVEKLPEAQRKKFMSLAYQIDDNHYLGVDDSKEPIQSEINEMYVNHSCDGNCWYQSDELLVAMRDIKAGEELCYDYALTEANDEWVLAEKCNCGTKICRGKVTGRDYQLPELQKKYGKHFLPYVQKKIAQHKQEHKNGASHAKPAQENKDDAGDDDDEEEPLDDGEMSEEDEAPKKKGKGKKKEKDEPAPEPSRRSNRARKENKKVTAAMEELSKGKRKQLSDGDDDDDDEPPKKRSKRGGRKKPSDDDDYDDGEF